jgi:hypothetical protein
MQERTRVDRPSSSVFPKKVGFLEGNSKLYWRCLMRVWNDISPNNPDLKHLPEHIMHDLLSLDSKKPFIESRSHHVVRKYLKGNKAAKWEPEFLDLSCSDAPITIADCADASWFARIAPKRLRTCLITSFVPIVKLEFDLSRLESLISDDRPIQCSIPCFGVRSELEVLNLASVCPGISELDIHIELRIDVVHLDFSGLTHLRKLRLRAHTVCYVQNCSLEIPNRLKQSTIKMPTNLCRLRLDFGADHHSWPDQDDLCDIFWRNLVRSVLLACQDSIKSFTTDMRTFLGFPHLPKLERLVSLSTPRYEGLNNLLSLVVKALNKGRIPSLRVFKFGSPSSYRIGILSHFMRFVIENELSCFSYDSSQRSNGIDAIFIAYLENHQTLPNVRKVYSTSFFTSALNLNIICPNLKRLTMSLKNANDANLDFAHVLDFELALRHESVEEIRVLDFRDFHIPVWIILPMIFKNCPSLKTILFRPAYDFDEVPWSEMESESTIISKFEPQKKKVVFSRRTSYLL